MTKKSDKTPTPNKHLERHTLKQTVRRAWGWFVLTLIALLLLEFVVTLHPHYPLEKTLFFNAWYGFISCAGIIAVSKFLGLFLKRSASAARR